MNACTARRDGKLIDARFARALSGRERSRMEDHLILCGTCRERYRRLQLAERVAAFGGDGDLDAPSPFEVERIAEGLGLGAPRRRSWLDLRWFAGAVSVAAAVALAGVYLRTGEDDLVARGGAEVKPSFSLYALSDRGARPLSRGESVSSGEHLKLRVSGAPVEGVHVVLVASDGRIEHASLAAPRDGSVPGAVSLADLPAGTLTAYAITGRFDLETIRSLASTRAGSADLARALGPGASVERFELDLGAPR
jgi:hypothetical protein